MYIHATPGRLAEPVPQGPLTGRLNDRPTDRHRTKRELHVEGHNGHLQLALQGQHGRQQEGVRGAAPAPPAPPPPPAPWWVGVPRSRWAWSTSSWATLPVNAAGTNSTAMSGRVASIDSTELEKLYRSVKLIKKMGKQGPLANLASITEKKSTKLSMWLISITFICVSCLLVNGPQEAWPNGNSAVWDGHICTRGLSAASSVTMARSCDGVRLPLILLLLLRRRIRPSRFPPLVVDRPRTRASFCVSSQSSSFLDLWGG